MARLLRPAIARVVAASILLLEAALIACSPTNHALVMHGVRARFAHQYFACVPLGWVPVPVAGTYFQGYSAELDETGWWLPPWWAGSIRISELKRPDVQVAYQVLNQLVRVGMLQRSTVDGGFQYHLTLRAMPYYYDRNDLGNNPEHFAYLCYSKIVPRRVLWTQAVRREPVAGEAGDMEVFRAAFEWIPGPPASWADDDFLRSHSIVLAPSRRPIVVKFVNWDGGWGIYSASMGYSPLPLIGVTDASVWPRSSP